MPPVVLETHILRERHRKKQELEADAEVERRRKERERQLKEDSMTLSETREQIATLDSRLSTLKEEKHQLFMQLKKVLHEDDTRRRQLLNKEQSEMLNVHNYLSQPGIQLGGGQMFLQPVLARPSIYNVSVPRGPHPQHPHTLLAPVQRFEGAMKRSRSPSPPSQQAHNYKFGPFKPPPQAMHPYPHKPSMPLQYFHTPVSQPPPPQQQQQPPPQQHQQHQQHVSVSYTSGPPHQSQPHQSQPHQSQQSQQPPPTMYPYSSVPPARSPQSNDQPKHVPTGLYLHPGQQLPRGYVLHQTIDHPTQSPKFADENPKYYSQPAHSLPVRGSAHLSLHPSISIQPPPQGASSGGITSGYPIRTTPSVSSYAGRPPSPHVLYTGGQGQVRHYAHPQHGQPTVPPHPQQVTHSQHSQQVTISRYSLPPGMSRE